VSALAGGLLGPDGQPIQDFYFNKKASPPKLGESFGQWSGPDIQYATLPGGGVVQFDLSKLTLADFRGMRDHYQVNASLAVLSFMQHQSDFHIECDNKSIADFCGEQIKNNWTGLNRALSTANWAGYSPSALEWDNDIHDQKIILGKVKDLIPEDCRVHWKEVPGWAPPGRTPPKFKVYDGIKQWFAGWPIPPENSLWYPMLMENGDHYGRKLLRPAFQSWFFSILLHLFANRYYERFGEPTPIGRAPYDEEVAVNGKQVNGSTFMLNLLQQLRSRSAVVLPNDRQQSDGSGKPSFDYSIEYLESQMRGADFERYMTRLDEEISIGLFTPILLLRTADVGSYSLGQGHMQMYLWMLNAMNDDRKTYLDKYVLSKMVDYNFGPNAPRAKIVFRKMGNTSGEMLSSMLTAMVNKGTVKVDTTELGQMVGMTLTEVKQTLAPPAAPADPNAPPADPNAPAPAPAKKAPGKPKTDPGKAPASPGKGNARASMSTVNATVEEIASRVRGQIEAAFRDNRFDGDLKVNMGYKRKFERALAAEGVDSPIDVSTMIYERMDNWVQDVVALGRTEFSSVDSFMGLFERVLDNEVSDLEVKV